MARCDFYGASSSHKTPAAVGHNQPGGLFVFDEEQTCKTT
jgi:hypothetical protein